MHKRNSHHRKTVIVNPLQAYNTLLRTAIRETSLSDKDLLLGFLRSRSYESLIDWASCQTPQLYGSPLSYFEGAGIASLIKKVPFPPELVPNLDPRKEAKSKYLDSELRCALFNQRAHDLDHDPVTLFARQYIQYVIGDTPPLQEVLEGSAISSGACIGVHGNKTNLARKLTSKSWSCSRSALPYGFTMVALNPHLSNVLTGSFEPTPDILMDEFKNRVSITNSNRVSFVPKTAKVERPIAIEPFLNSMLQGCVDKFMRNRLRKRGNIDLTDQSRNQEMARQGSLPDQSDPYATVDLEAASDSLSIELVRLLVPPEWFAFLDDLRSSHYEDDGVVRKYAKFCSMGNGFCFPLESLIFAALIYGTIQVSNGNTLPNFERGETTICSGVLDFSVYGDDLIVRQSIAYDLCDNLERFGLRVNSKKSFLDGPFRESCGADWFLGKDVRPVVLTKWLVDTSQMVALHNSFYRSSVCHNWGLSLQEWIRGFLHRPLMRPGKEPGDTCLSVPQDLFMSCPTARWNRHLYSFSWLELTPQPIEDSDIACEESLARALNYGMLAGCKSDKPFVLRYSTKRYPTRVCRPFRDCYHGQSFGSLYETAVTAST